LRRLACCTIVSEHPLEAQGQNNKVYIGSQVILERGVAIVELDNSKIKIGERTFINVEFPPITSNGVSYFKDPNYIKTLIKNLRVPASDSRGWYCFLAIALVTDKLHYFVGLG
jgi:hypothetical protein